MGFDHFFFVDINEKSKAPGQVAGSDENQSEKQIERSTVGTKASPLASAVAQEPASTTDSNDVSKVFAEVMRELKTRFLLREQAKKISAAFFFTILEHYINSLGALDQEQIEVQTNGSSPGSDSDFDYQSDTDFDDELDSNLDSQDDDEGQAIRFAC